MALLLSSYRKQTYILYFYQWMFWRCKLPLHISWADIMTFSIEKRIEVNVRDIYFTGIGINKLLFYKFKISSYAKCFHFYKLNWEISNENPKLKWEEFSKKIKILKNFLFLLYEDIGKPCCNNVTQMNTFQMSWMPTFKFCSSQREMAGSCTSEPEIQIGVDNTE